MNRRNFGTPDGSRGFGPWLSAFCGAALLFTGVLIGWTLAPVGEPVRPTSPRTERPERLGGSIPTADSTPSSLQETDYEVAMDESELESEEAEPSTADAEDPAVLAWNGAVDAIVAAQDAGNCPTSEAIAAFKATFDALTDEQKTEHLQEALNLFADESFDCLSVILLDSKEPEDVLQSMLGDLTTRSSEVRDSALRKLAANPSHPLAGDAGELLEGTGFRRRRARRSSNRD